MSWQKWRFRSVFLIQQHFPVPSHFLWGGVREDFWNDFPSCLEGAGNVNPSLFLEQEPKNKSVLRRMKSGEWNVISCQLGSGLRTALDQPDMKQEESLAKDPNYLWMCIKETWQPMRHINRCPGSSATACFACNGWKLEGEQALPKTGCKEEQISGSYSMWEKHGEGEEDSGFPEALWGKANLRSSVCCLACLLSLSQIAA